MAHVAHLTSAHPRDDIRIFLKECCGLAKHGHFITLVVADGLGEEDRNDVRILDIGHSSGRLDRMLKTTRRVYSQAARLDADVYHLHDPELMSVGLKLKRLGKKVVFDAHEDVPRQLLGKHYLSPLARRLLSFAFARFERYACARFDGVVAATPHIRDKFSLINPKTVDINNFPMEGELEADIPWGNKADEVCYVGGIATIRGIREMVHAMERVNTAAKLNLVGGFAEPAVQSEVSSYTGWRSINALGVKNRSEVRDVLARSRAGLVVFHPLPNHVDAQPNKMFEYMSAGVPVIASNFPLWREIIEGNQCGLCVDPLRPEQIAAAIDYLVSHPDEARRMGENGRRAVKDRYNWAREEYKLQAFYGDLLGEVR
jgi:glycosyltransferase involved in cell wall biosynthesis